MDIGWLDAARADGSLTVVREEIPGHGGSVRHPGSGVDGTHRLTFMIVMKDSENHTA